MPRRKGPTTIPGCQKGVCPFRSPESVKTWNRDRALDCHFDMVSVDGEFFLAKPMLEMARTGEKGFSANWL